MIAVGVNGYGSIGKRVADAVAAQPDMTVAGVAKTSPNHEARSAVSRGYDLYVSTADRVSAFAAADVDTAGTVEDLFGTSDVVVDATPSGVGAEYRTLYDDHDTPAIFQGGEDADVADVSFNARANFDAARGADTVRVVSCNSTGLCRLATPLADRFGVERMRVTLVRRGGDPVQSDRGPINDILPDPVTTPSHHGPDVRTVIPDLDIDTQGLKVPATLMHVHAVNATLAGEATAEDVRDLLASESRIEVFPAEYGVDGCAALKEVAADAGRPRGDLWENAVWGESITVRDGDLYLFQAIHQESDVVPENVDAVRAVTDSATAAESRELTDETLGIGL
ncbi:MAG: type II glyceraldehyde-3-phosphate dehydrogenase [Halobacteriaceae archaeon]